MTDRESREHTGGPAPGSSSPLRWMALMGAFRLAAFCLFVAVGFALTGLYFLTLYSDELPDITTLRDYRPSLVTKLLDNRHRPFAEFFIEKRILLPLESIPERVIQATIAVEDRNFYTHMGIDMSGISRAFLANVKAGEVTQGGSTITQQVAKVLFLSPERKFERKFKEILLALKIEQQFTKNEILEIYLNQIYYGHGAYGIEAASKTYFGKSAKDLTLAETALLAGLPRAPKYYSPYFTESGALRRRSHVLRRMLDEGFIGEEEFQQADTEPIHLVGLSSTRNDAPYYAELVRQFLENQFGSSNLYRGGLVVYTPLDRDMQRAANESIQRGLQKLDKELGYLGPLNRRVTDGDRPAAQTVSPEEILAKLGKDPNRPDGFRLAQVAEVHPGYAVVQVGDSRGILHTEDLAWARPPNPESDALYKPPVKDATGVLRSGDVIWVAPKPDAGTGTEPLYQLEQEPQIQGSLLSMDPKTGRILAMVGGYDFYQSEFNRAVQALRQPGSSFKPIIYAAAFDRGFTPSTVIIDSPIIFDHAMKDSEFWKPMNFKEEFYGPTTLRTALTQSRNIVTIKLLQKIGLSYLVNYGRTLGIVSPLSPNLSLALGSSSLTLLELVRVYGVFANNGIQVEPVFIEKILNRDGKLLLQNEISAKRVIRPEIAFQTTTILENVIQEGTGQVVRPLGRPVAGKTGTTDNFVDAWFLGFTPNLVTGVWVGKDQREPMGKNETGSRAAAPIWLDYMQKAVSKLPVYDFEVPENVVFVRVDEDTGQLATDGTRKPIFECFVDGTEPRQTRPEEKSGQEKF